VDGKNIRECISAVVGFFVLSPVLISGTSLGTETEEIEATEATEETEETEETETTEAVERGNTLICDTCNHRVIEVDGVGTTILWTYSAGAARPYDAERLDNGNTLIAEWIPDLGPGRVVEVDSSGNTVWQMGGFDFPMDVERLANGNTLITDSWGGCVVEVDPLLNVVWDKSDDLVNPADAERLPNGNTLIVDLGNNRVVEVNPEGTIIWVTPWSGSLSLQDVERMPSGNTLVTSFLPGWGMAFEIDSLFNIIWQESASVSPTDAERLPNGNTLICEAYHNNAVVEVDSAGNVVWAVSGLGLNWVNDVERLYPTAEKLIEDVIEEIEATTFPAGTENAIIKKLYGALAKLDTDNADAVVGKLGAFVNQVNALLSSGRITQAQADELTEAVMEIIDMIEG